MNDIAIRVDQFSIFISNSNITSFVRFQRLSTANQGEQLPSRGVFGKKSCFLYTTYKKNPNETCTNEQNMTKKVRKRSHLSPCRRRPAHVFWKI